MKSAKLNQAMGAIAVLAAGALPLVATAPASGLAAPRVTVTSPSHDAPGASMMVIVTVANVPVGYTISKLTARVGMEGDSCDAFRWKHSDGVSQKCAVNLPTKVGTWTLRSVATLTKAGQPTLNYTGSKTIKTTGQATHPVSASVRERISKCYNTSKNLWLTFDDGYTSQANLNSILYTLKAYNVRGRFFLVGSWARSNPSMVRQIKAAGHYIANHTDTHPALSSISNASVSSQIAHGQAANTSPKLLRPPYGAGAYTSRLYSLAQGKGYRLCHWGSDTRDWSGNSAATIVRKVVHGDSETSPARAGDVVLMHLTNTNTRYALPTLIKALRAKHLRFERLR